MAALSIFTFNIWSVPSRIHIPLSTGVRGKVLAAVEEGEGSVATGLEAVDGYEAADSGSVLVGL